METHSEYIGFTSSDNLSLLEDSSSRLHCIQMGPYRTEEIHQINRMFDVLNAKTAFKLGTAHISRAEYYAPQYEATIIKDNANEVRDTAIVLLPGFIATGSLYAPVTEAMYTEAHTHPDFKDKIGLVATISSSLSRDTLNKPFSSSVIKRAANQALFIQRLLDTSPTITQLNLAGQSLGGAELPYVVLCLQEMMKSRIDAGTLRINTMVLLQPGGQYDQSFPELAKGVPEILALPNEYAYFFPTPLAKRLADTNKLHIPITDFDERFEHQYVLMPRVLKEIDTLIEETIKDKDYKGDFSDFENHHANDLRNWNLSTEERKDMRELLEYRRKLVDQFIAGYSNSDKRGNPMVPSVLLGIRHAFKDILRATPRYIKDHINIPVKIVVGKYDQFFPEERYNIRTKTQTLYKNQTVTVNSWAHQVPLYNPQAYGKLIVEMCQK